MAEWIARRTRGLDTVVEFGAGRFNYTAMIAARQKIGVEIFEPYCTNFTATGVGKVCGDMRKYRELALPDFDAALFVDSIEHIDKDDAVELLMRLQEDTGRILVFVPHGRHDQKDDAWGFNNPWQEHRSTWVSSDLVALDFNVVVDPNFHHQNPRHKRAAMFAEWNDS